MNVSGFMGGWGRVSSCFMKGGVEDRILSLRFSSLTGCCDWQTESELYHEFIHLIRSSAWNTLKSHILCTVLKRRIYTRRDGWLLLTRSSCHMVFFNHFFIILSTVSLSLILCLSLLCFLTISAALLKSI